MQHAEHGFPGKIADHVACKKACSWCLPEGKERTGPACCGVLGGHLPSLAFPIKAAIWENFNGWERYDGFQCDRRAPLLLLVQTSAFVPRLPQPSSSHVRSLDRLHYRLSQSLKRRRALRVRTAAMRRLFLVLDLSLLRQQSDEQRDAALQQLTTALARLWAAYQPDGQGGGGTGCAATGPHSSWGYVLYDSACPDLLLKPQLRRTAKELRELCA